MCRLLLFKQGEKMKRLRILVTGGAGFLGSHLCEKLVHAQHDVICLDNYFTGNKYNVEHLMDYRNFELLLLHTSVKNLFIDNMILTVVITTLLVLNINK